MCKTMFIKKILMLKMCKTFKNKKIIDKTRKYIYNGMSIYKFLAGGGIMKRTYQPNNHRRSKKQGFLARMKTKIVNNRRRKGRKVLAR